MNTTRQTQCAGGLIYNDKNQIIIVNQNHDSWSLPKGHVDEGETILEAAIREIYEETGLDTPKYIKSLGQYGRYRIGLDGNDDKSEYKNIAIFLFKSNENKLVPIDPNNPEAKWVSVDEALDLLTHEADKIFLKNSLPLWLDR